MFKPFEIFNDIVNGLILGIYDIVVLLVGPLIAPLRRRKLRIWKFILDVENRFSSLTIMFICLAGVVSFNAPDIIRDIIQRVPLQSGKLNYRFLFVLILTIVLTIFLDVLFHLLIYLRTISLNVNFSRVRLVVLRLYSCIIIIVVTMVDLVPFVVWYNSDNPMLPGEPGWVPFLRALIISLSAIPFSVSLLHLTHRLRVRAKWLVAIPFGYSFVNLTLGIGFYMGMFLAILFGVLGDPEQVRLFAFNTRCMMIDYNTVSVESDILLKTNWYDAIEVQDESVFADVGNQLIPLKGVNGNSNILVSDKLVHTKWRGTLIPNVEQPKLDGQAAPCKMETYGIFWSEPERVKTMEGG